MKGLIFIVIGLFLITNMLTYTITYNIMERKITILKSDIFVESVVSFCEGFKMGQQSQQILNEWNKLEEKMEK